MRVRTDVSRGGENVFQENVARSKSGCNDTKMTDAMKIVGVSVTIVFGPSVASSSKFTGVVTAQSL